MFKKLRSLFLEKIPENDAHKMNPKDSAQNEATFVDKTLVPPTQLPDGGVGGNISQPSEKFIQLLLRALEENNIEGFDYLEFKQSVQKLKEAGTTNTEEGLYKSAFVMSQTMGSDKARLIDTGRHYLRVLDDEVIKFESALKNNYDQQIARRQEKLILVDKKIVDDEAKMERLRKSIEKLNDDKKKLKGQISQASIKIKATQSSFLATLKILTDQIKEDLKKINQYV